jgi:glycosyltransferase involved in cell wall biosynthesis
MKFLCVTPSYWPAFRYGGPIISNHNLNKTLVKKGIDVIVYTTNAGLNEKISLNQEVNVDGVKVSYFTFIKFFEFLGSTGWQFSLKLTRALRRNLNNFDLVYLPAVWNYPTTIAAYYCRKYRKPYIVAPKGVLFSYTKSKNAWKKWPYYKLFAERDIKNAAAIHYTAEDEANRCHSLFLGLKNQAIIVPNGIELSAFNNLPARNNLWMRYPILKNKKIILFLGRISWIKGLDLLVEAFSRLARERNDVHLMIVGPDENNYVKKVKKWFRDEGIFERVTFTGMKVGEEKLKAFTSSDVFVLPSYSENFGMAVVEAMACSIPVIISDQVGIYREVERAKAGVIIHTDPDELYNVLVKLVDNKQKSLEMGRRGRKLVEEQFSIEKVADKMIKKLEEIIK